VRKSMIDRQAIIQTVAEKHGVLLGDDDPILSFLAVHDVVLDEYRKQFERADAGRQVQLERLIDRFSDQAAKAVGTAVGKEREYFLQVLKTLLETERNAPRKNDRVLSVILWSVISASVAASVVLLLINFL